jgi:RimJ/RimL family protein N-acetyltransferase
MRLELPTKEDLEIVRQWRNENPQNYRTTIQLTPEQQEDYYNRVICDRKSDTRLWMVWNSIGHQPAGMIGLEFISVENRNAELLFVWNPRNEFNPGEAETLVNELLKKAFLNVNLENVYIEVYECNDIFHFWKGIADKYHCKKATLENKRYYDGEYWNALYFTINRKGAVK